MTDFKDIYVEYDAEFGLGMSLKNVNVGNNNINPKSGAPSEGGVGTMSPNKSMVMSEAGGSKGK